MTNNQMLVILGLWFIFVCTLILIKSNATDLTEPTNPPVTEQRITLNIANSVVELTCTRSNINGSVVFDCYEGEVR